MTLPVGVPIAGAAIAAWVALWDDLSWANVAVGVLLAAVVGFVERDRVVGREVHLRALAALIWLVLVDLVRSTIAVAREVITPTDRTDEAVVAVVLDPEAFAHLLLLTVAITLTPGTAVVDSDRSRSTLYLHLLHASEEEATVLHVHELARLATTALPVPEGVPT